MKTNKDSLDKFVYVVACIFSFGVVWVARVTISMAIRKSMEE